MLCTACSIKHDLVDQEVSFLIGHPNIRSDIDLRLEKERKLVHPDDLLHSIRQEFNVADGVSFLLVEGNRFSRLDSAISLTSLQNGVLVPSSRDSNELVICVLAPDAKALQSIRTLRIDTATKGSVVQVVKKKITGVAKVDLINLNTSIPMNFPDLTIGTAANLLDIMNKVKSTCSSI